MPLISLERGGQMPNPDDRSDNVEKLQRSIDNTMSNLRESEDFVKAHGDEMHVKDREDIEAKNQRRERAIGGFRSEIKDEVNDQ
jgi:small acid-soluble spore protein (thioredoxin-like protein)